MYAKSHQHIPYAYFTFGVYNYFTGLNKIFRYGFIILERI